MLYTVNPCSSNTQDHLLEVVNIQVHLLKYAKINSSLSQSECCNFLKLIPKFTTTAEEISKWIWNSEKRFKGLEKFALGVDQQKQSFVKEIAQDIENFGAGRGQLIHLAVPKNQKQAWEATEEWKRGGWLFLAQFYEDLNNIFPKRIFLSQKAFGAQDFLADFINHNKRLGVCAACEESAFHTVRAGGILAEKDHYLPKSLYPHLCCHPYNLVPICHLCNAPKSNKDPLHASDGSRLALQDIHLPYREEGLYLGTHLEVVPTKDHVLAKLERIDPNPGKNIQTKVDAVRELYDIPGRWDRSQPADKLGERLFERIFDEMDTLLASYQSKSAFRAALERLFYKVRRDQGKTPSAYTYTWWLFTILEKVIEPWAVDAPLDEVNQDLINNFWSSVELKLRQKEIQFGEKEMAEIIALDQEKCEKEQFKQEIEFYKNKRKEALFS